MAIYIYGCKNKHRIQREHAMMETPLVLCPTCSLPMHKVPQISNVVWNGLPPHLEISRPPVIQNFIDTAGERRAKYNDTKDKHNG